MTDAIVRALRTDAVGRSLAPAASIVAAVEALRFVQFDPIRAPARAADLILRQRVPGYRAGDLDRAYPALDLAEDFLHVYGVMPRATRDLLHPRNRRERFRVESEFPRLPARVLAHVAERGDTHPRSPLPARTRSPPRSAHASCCACSSRSTRRCRSRRCASSCAWWRRARYRLH